MFSKKGFTETSWTVGKLTTRGEVRQALDLSLNHANHIIAFYSGPSSLSFSVLRPYLCRVHIVVHALIQDRRELVLLHDFADGGEDGDAHLRDGHCDRCHDSA